MTEEHWQRLSGEHISEYVPGDGLHVSEHRAVFRLAAPAEHLNAGSCLMLREVPDRKTCEAERNRFLEAMFLEHPNLIRIYDSGCFCDDGRWLHFAVTEPLDEALADVARPIPPAEWAIPIASALSYLHQNQLVHCALSPAAIRRAAGTWKLGDFSELRTQGTYSPQDTRRLMIRAELSVPPEAWEGVVSPAWDVWSLGSMLRIAGCEDPVVADMLEPNPAERVSVAGLLAGSALTTLNAKPPDPVSSPGRPEPPAPIAAPQFTEPRPVSLHARAVLAKAAGFTRASRRIVVWTSVAIAFAVLLLLAAAMSGQRAPVRQSSSRIATPAAQQAEPQLPAPQHAIAERPAADPRLQIDRLLSRWAESTRARDVDGLVACYAPAVRQFFGSHNLRTADLIRVKQDAFNSVGPIRTFNVSAISFDSLTADSAVVSFRKQWDFPARHFSGIERDQMELRRFGDEWKIVSEREIGHRKTEMGD